MPSIHRLTNTVTPFLWSWQPWIQLHRVHIFSELVLWSTYNLIQVHEGEEWKTVFITPSGHYEYLVMPYGFANSPSAIHGLMNVFWEYLDHFVFIYIYTHLCTLDIYAASKPSYSSAICTGGPIWPRMSPNSSEVARSVPSKKCLQSCPSSICSIALGFPRILSQTEVLSSFTEYGMPSFSYLVFLWFSLQDITLRPMDRLSTRSRN